MLHGACYGEAALFQPRHEALVHRSRKADLEACASVLRPKGPAKDLSRLQT